MSRRPGQPWCGVSEDWGWPMSVAVVDAEDWPDGIPAESLDPQRPYASLVVRRMLRPVGVMCIAAGGGATGAMIGPLPSEPTGPPPDLLPASGDLPAVTVVVCTRFDRRRTLLECLASLRALDGAPAEILVVDNRPRADAQSRREVEALGGVRVLHESRPGLAAARNRALRAASGELIAFTDDDALVDPIWLRALAGRLRAHPEEVGVCGLVLPRALDTAAQVRLETYRGGFGPRGLVAVSHRLRTVPRPGRVAAPYVDALDDRGRVLDSALLYEFGQYGVGANMAFRTAALRAAGGFDVRLGAGTPTCGGEDIELFVRLVGGGHALGFEPAAIVFHEHRRTAQELRLQMRQYGTGFTATLTALLANDPRRALAMGGTLAAVVRARARDGASASGGGRSRGSTGVQRATLRRLEFRGMARGPDAFLRSWLRATMV